MSAAVLHKTVLVLTLVFNAEFSKAQNNTDAAVAAEEAPRGLASRMTCGLSDQKLDSKAKSTLQKHVETYRAQSPCRPLFVDQKLEAPMKMYVGNYGLCAERSRNAAMHCMEGCSPAVSTMIMAVNATLTGVRQAGLVDACGRFDKAMRIAEVGFTAFGANCGTRKLLCDNACSAAGRALNQMKSLLVDKITPADVKHCAPTVTITDPQWAVIEGGYEGFKKSALNAIVQDLDNDNPEATASRTQVCAGYQTQLLAASANLISTIASAKKAKQCKEETTAGVDTRKECEKPENQAKPQCICEKNPRTPGCDLYVDANASGTKMVSTGGAPVDPRRPTSGAASVDLGNGSETKMPEVAPSSAAATAGGAAGGGSGGLEGGGSGDGVDEGRKTEIVKKINTGVYAGEGGGGGGGWGSPGRSPSGDGSAGSGWGTASSAEREMASLRSQVSSPGGKSNWEKVRARYSAQKQSLIGQ